MTLTHILETLILVMLAYLSGCTIGYVARRTVHAGRGTRTVAPLAGTSVPPAPEADQLSRRQMTPAARLAAATTDDESMPAAVVPAQPIQARTPGPRQARTAAASPATAESAPKSAPKPASMPRPRAGDADNLKQIKGIGPKIERALNDLGIYHFDQIAALSRANVDWVDKQLAFKGRIHPRALGRAGGRPCQPDKGQSLP
ncbi:MAG: hypothetical protein MO852_14955, partial [Candidatus Devosia euplotis]|nr:hypothetical protein [Candidatus Devosia euplotis]